MDDLPETKEVEQSSAYESTYKPNWVEMWTLRVNIATFFVLSLTLVAVFWYACEVTKANILTRKMLKGSQAANLVLNFSTAGFGEITALHLQGMNLGKVAAKGVSGWIEISREMLDGTEPITSSRYDFGGAEYQIGPNSPFSFRFLLHGFSQKDAGLVKQTRELLKVQGLMVYEDGFDNSVRQPFCNTYLFIQFPNGSSSDGWFDCAEAERMLLDIQAAR